ncbi:hypothetical protein PIROE2DRAFT_9224 [Piromyces sp. E2]|nr:hypothetical protein PIROE2DRAFT_9224 [Piromyces sp. E2]|eukprot:OUM64118.1 hypothetical protein PIROE2DRAFT_9224 [Piromyces sp. E2]
MGEVQTLIYLFIKSKLKVLVSKTNTPCQVSLGNLIYSTSEQLVVLVKKTRPGSVVPDDINYSVFIPKKNDLLDYNYNDYRGIPLINKCYQGTKLEAIRELGIKFDQPYLCKYNQLIFWDRVPAEKPKGNHPFTLCNHQHKVGWFLEPWKHLQWHPRDNVQPEQPIPPNKKYQYGTFRSIPY